MRTNRLIALWLGGTALASPAAAQQASHGHDPDRAQMPAQLERQLEQVREATAPYRDHAAAVADGFKLFGSESPLMGEHWYHPDRVKQPFDLERPSTLQYATIDGRRELVGVAYTVYRRPDDPMPNGFAGDADLWHVHDLAKIGHALTEDRPFLRFIVNRRIERGRIGAGDGRTHLTMVHAWLWLENPDGPFAQQHRALPYVRVGLPASYAETGDAAAASGVSLLTDGTCKMETRRVHALARLSGRQRSQLNAVCGHAQNVVVDAYEPGVSATEINAAAAAAWSHYLEARDAILTPDQHARLATAIEHPHGMGRH